MENTYSTFQKERQFITDNNQCIQSIKMNRESNKFTFHLCQIKEEEIGGLYPLMSLKTRFKVKLKDQ